MEHNNILCSSRGRDNGICCGSCVQTSALVTERKGKTLRLQHGKVDGSACGDWRAGRCETWHCLPRKGEIRASPFVGRGAGVDNLKFHFSFHVQSARRQGGAELQHEGLCVVVWKGSVCLMSSRSCLASEYVTKKIQLQETESRENGTEMPPFSFPPCNTTP